MPGSLPQPGFAAKAVNRRPVVAWVLLVTNHGGLGERVNSPAPSARWDGRNGPRTTVRSADFRRSALCTTPIPLCTSASVCPGYAPHVALAVRKPNPVHALTATAP